MDHVLFIVGGALLLVAFLLLLGLFRSRKRSREYRRVLATETQRVDVLNTLRETEALATARTGMSTGGSTGAALTDRTVMSPGATPTDRTVLSPGAAPTDRTVLPTGAAPALVQDDVTVVSHPAASAPPDAGDDLTATGEVIGDTLDLAPLEGKYELLRELYGGGMSRVFLARHAALGNEWVVKYVEGAHAELANEAEVLKKLNHISLPQIIDIFQNDRGTFLVERYIEGYSLDKVLSLGELKESQLCDWALQLAQVLHYLHTLETPIIHCDLKPSNIMVTYDDRLVLIDFGISKRQGVDEKQVGITYRYAAPEQFKGRLARSKQAAQRFGQLPPGQKDWEIDPRTDLYSVGVILYELIVGETPVRGDLSPLYKKASSRLADVVAKCLELEPGKRYQSAKELAEAVERLKGHQTTMVRSLTLRRVAAACCALCTLAGVGTTASAAYLNQQENLAVVDMDPGRAVVTAQQSVQLLLQKTMPSGEVVSLEPSQLQWSYSQENIARIDGDRLVGLNVGETTLYGQYRNKVISLNVTVAEPVAELVEVALRYPDGPSVESYAGSGKREMEDGSLADCSFISPQDLSARDGALYITDSGAIRILEDGQVSSLVLEPDFLTADRVREWEGDLYVLTGPWTDEDELDYYGILRITDEGAEFLYYTEAAWSTIADLAFSSDGRLWFIQQNLGTGATTLNTLDLDALEAVWVMDLPDSAQGMAFDGQDNLYMAVPETGTIIRVAAGADRWTYFAGVEGQRHFVDGAIPNFYRPTALAARDNALYVLDFDTVRKITVEGEGALFTETLVGVPTADTDPEVKLGPGSQAVLPASELADLAVDGEENLLLSDPKGSLIYEIQDKIHIQEGTV